MCENKLCYDISTKFITNHGFLHPQTQLQISALVVWYIIMICALGDRECTFEDNLKIMYFSNDNFLECCDILTEIKPRSCKNTSGWFNQVSFIMANV